MSAPAIHRPSAVQEVQDRRRSNAAGPHRVTPTRQGTRRHRMDAALAEWGLTRSDVLSGNH